MQVQLVRLPKVLEIIPAGKTTLYAWINAGQFPAPVQLGGRAVAWRVADIEAWIATRPVAR